MNEKYSDPFEDIMLEFTFCRYPMRHGAEVVDGVGEVAAEGAAELVAERVVELAAALARRVGGGVRRVRRVRTNPLWRSIMED